MRPRRLQPVPVGVVVCSGAGGDEAGWGTTAHAAESLVTAATDEGGLVDAYEG